MLRAAGLAPGMRVLDLGCGTGDFSFVAAEIVGDYGQVVGVDRSAEALAAARTRAAAKELFTVEFVQDDVASVTPDDGFDAVIGRLVLMYLQDPASVLRRMRAALRPGGVAAFIDITIPADFPATAECPLIQQCHGWIRQAFHRAGAQTDMGLRQARVFKEAGFGWPEMVIEGVPVVGPDPFKAGWLAATVRSLLPVIERTGIATAAEVDIDTLADRFLAEMDRTAAIIFPVSFGGAWATVTA